MTRITALALALTLVGCAPLTAKPAVHAACDAEGIDCFALRGVDRVKPVDARFSSFSGELRDPFYRLSDPVYQLQWSPDDCAEDEAECVRLVREFAACLRGTGACPVTGLVLW